MNAQLQTSLATHEKAVIGTILLSLDGRAMACCVRHGVESDWFSPDLYKRIYQMALDYYVSNRPISSLIIADAMLTAIPSASVAAEIEAAQDSVTNEAHIEYHLECLAKLRLVSRAEVAASQTVQRIKTIDVEAVESTIASVQSDWFALSNASRRTETMRATAERLIEKHTSQKQTHETLSWPLSILNRQIGHIEDDLIFLCAQESVGKTALALQTALCLSHNGTKSAFRSLESSAERIIPRLISQLSGVNWWTVKQGRATPDDIARARRAGEALEQCHIALTCEPATIEQLVAWAQYEKARGARMLFVDNLRHIRDGSRHKSETERYAHLSLQCKHLRDTVRMPVMVLHHINSHTGDVAWSTDIRRDADILLLMAVNETETVRPDESNGYRGKWVVDFDVQKNRDGDAGFKLQAIFDKPVQTFRDAALPTPEEHSGDGTY